MQALSKASAFGGMNRPKAHPSMPDSSDTPMHPNFSLRPPHLILVRRLLGGGRHCLAAAWRCCEASGASANVEKPLAVCQLCPAPETATFSDLPWEVCFARAASLFLSPLLCQFQWWPATRHSRGGHRAEPHSVCAAGCSWSASFWVSLGLVGLLVTGHAETINDASCPIKDRRIVERRSSEKIGPRTKESLVNWHPANAGRSSVSETSSLEPLRSQPAQASCCAAWNEEVSNSRSRHSLCKTNSTQICAETMVSTFGFS